MYTFVLLIMFREMLFRWNIIRYSLYQTLRQFVQLYLDSIVYTVSEVDSPTMARVQNSSVDSKKARKERSYNFISN